MSETAPRSRRFAVALIVALLVLAFGFVVGVDHARLSRLEKSWRAGDQTADLENLTSQLAVWASDVEALKTAPRAASATTVDTLKADWERRWSALEDATLGFASAPDLTAVKERMAALETRLARAFRKTNVASANAIAVNAASSSSGPSPLTPPFVPLGIELRGDERFLSILPSDASSLGQARALRSGDREGTWILERLERDVAEFRVEGQLQRLSVPQ